MSLSNYKADMLAYFKSLGLLPIIVPEGQHVGDVYNASGPDPWLLEDRAGRCFPTLAPVAGEKGALPAVSLRSAEEAGFALGLAKMLNLSTSAGRQQQASIVFSDVLVETVSRGELKQALAADCGYLRPIVDETVVPSTEMSVKVVVGKVVYARPAVFFGVDENVTASAQVDGLAAVLPAASLALRKLDANASAQLGFGRRTGVLVEATAAMPVAFSPAFLVKPVFDRTMGANSVAVVLRGYQWQGFDVGLPDQRQLFEALVDASIQ